MNEIDTTVSSESFYRAENLSVYGFILLVLLTVVTGGFLRIYQITDRSLDYDEAWSFVSYSSKGLRVIFTDLSTPNNHTLHSALVYLSTQLLGGTTLAIRLPALVAGILAFLCFPILPYLLSGRRPLAGLLGLALFGLDGFQMYYSQSARGYSLQVLLFILLAIGIWLRETESARYRHLSLSALAILPIAAFVLLPSSILFILPLGILHLFFSLRADGWKLWPWMKSHRASLIAYCISGSLCILWLAYGFSMFRVGREQFSMPIGSVTAFIGFIATTLRSLCPWYIYALAAVGLVFQGRSRQLFIAGVIGGAVVFLLSIFIGAGPARVYLPLQIPIYASACLSAYVAIERIGHLRLAWGLPVATVLLAIVAAPGERSRRLPVDWYKVSTQVESALGADDFIVYPAGFTFEILFRKGVGQSIQAGLRLPHSERPVYVLQHPAISGVDLKSGNEQRISLQDVEAIQTTELPSGLPIYAYRIVPMDSAGATASDVWMVSISSTSRSDYFGLIRVFLERYPGEWLKINPFFASELHIHDESHKPKAVLIAAAPSMPREIMERIQVISEGRVVFYRLQTAGKDNVLPEMPDHNEE